MSMPIASIQRCVSVTSRCVARPAPSRACAADSAARGRRCPGSRPAARQRAGAASSRRSASRSGELLQHRVVEVVEDLGRATRSRNDASRRRRSGTCRSRARRPAARRASSSLVVSNSSTDMLRKSLSGMSTMCFPSIVRPGLPHAELEQLHVHGFQDRGGRHHRIRRRHLCTFGKRRQRRIARGDALRIEPHRAREQRLDLAVAQVLRRRQKCPPRAARRRRT